MAEQAVHSYAGRRATAEFGMWVFLATEVLFFGGLFLAYIVYRYWYPAGFHAGGRESDLFLGTLNTLILMTSSFFMTLAVEEGQKDSKKRTLIFLALVGVLGMIFLGIKAAEWGLKFEHGLYPGEAFLSGQAVPQGMRMFFSFYFVMTGLHALHLIIGLGLWIWIFVISARNRRIVDAALHLEIFGLYWHFVDVIWIFLFPLFYLVGRHG